MKRALVVLSAASSLLSGCIVYSPSPSTSDLGYTYDFSLPLAGAARPAIPTYFSEIPERSPSYVAEQVPPPPRVPPVYSTIPDVTPGPAAPAGQTTRTVIVPSSPTI